MATNIYNSNHLQSIDWVNTSGTAIASGDIVVMGTAGDATLGVALVDIANGSTGSIGINCGVIAAKETTAAFANGESLIYQAATGTFTGNGAIAATGDIAGSSRAASNAANGDTSCRVWLTGVPGNITP